MNAVRTRPRHEGHDTQVSGAGRRIDATEPAGLADTFSVDRLGCSARRDTRSAGQQLPSPRGPLSHAVIKAISRPTGSFKAPIVRSDDVLTDEDFQLALYCCYELHYQGFAHVSDDWEWNPGLLTLRSQLEEVFERSLRAAVPDDGGVEAVDVPDALWGLSRDGGFSLSAWLLTHGTTVSCEGARNPPLRLPAEGSRPPHVGHSPFERSGQGSHGDDPG